MDAKRVVDAPKSGSSLLTLQADQGKKVNGLNVWPILQRAWLQFRTDKVPRMGAALAYYTIFSVSSLVVIAVAVAGWVFGQEAAQGAIISELQELVGQSSAIAIQSMVQAARKPSAGVLATIVGIVVLLFGASGVFAEMRDALNTIWQVKPATKGGIRHLLRDRLASFTMVAGAGFLLLVSLIFSAALTAFGKFWQPYLPVPEVILSAIDFIVSLVITALLFALIFKILPAVSVAWSDVWPGAILTAVLFTLGKFAIGFYIGKAASSTAYGAAAALVVLLIWVYYSAQIFYFGAEFTRLYAHEHGSRSGSKIIAF